jgi:bla regulator protein BlaR1
MNSLETVLEWLLAATLRASALAVIILVCQQVMRRQMSAQWRYALWLPMLLVLVLPSLPAVPFGLFPWKTSAPVVVDIGKFTVTGMPVVEKSVKIAEVGSQPTPVNALSIAWLIGAGGVFAAGWIGYRRSMKRIVKNAVAPEESLLGLLKATSMEAGLARVPRMIVSTAVDSPAVTGIFRPTLLLPAHFPDGFSEEEARLVVLHEFIHLKRQDLVVNGLACVLQALHWFNPILWFAFARMRADRESACDASVLSIGAADRRAAYGGALLKLQGRFCSRGLSLGFVGIFERSAGMKSRIREISSHSPGKRSGWSIGLGVIALLVTFGATKAEEPVPQAVVEKAAEPTPDGYAYITKKLTTIVIPRVDAEDMSLEEMVDFLTLRVKQLDTAEKDPAKKGVNFGIRKNPGEGVVQAGHITIKKKDVLLMDVVKEMADQSGMLFSWGDYGVTFVKRGQEMADFVTSAPVLPPLPQGKAADFAMKLIIPRVDFEETTLRDAVDFLNKKAREMTKDGPVYPIVLDPSVDPNAKIREMRLRNCPVLVTLDYCKNQLKYKLTADDKELRFSLP